MTDAEIRAAVEAAHERIIVTFSAWRAIANVDPKAVEADAAGAAYFEAVSAMNDLRRKVGESRK